jgi:epoxyqueuosine reductase QueG
MPTKIYKSVEGMYEMDTKEVKQVLYNLGADLCGVAPLERFGEAPQGFHPCDVLPQCKSVVVFAKVFPAATISCKTTIPYTITRNMLSDMLDKISVHFCIKMEQHGIMAVPTGTISHTQYDVKTGRWRNIVSAKHCAVAAGLGRIGRNTLVTTPEYGNMVWLDAILTDAQLKPDELLTDDPCPTGCSLCIDNCPANALGKPELNQQACRAYAFHIKPGEEFLIKCHKCRTICPNCLGSKNRITEYSV